MYLAAFLDKFKNYEPTFWINVYTYDIFTDIEYLFLSILDTIKMTFFLIQKNG